MSDAVPSQDQRSHEPDAPDRTQGGESKKLATAELGRLITEGRQFLPVRTSTQDVLDRLDTFQAAIETKLGELEQSIRTLTPASTSARRSTGQLLSWIVATAIVASGATFALVQLVR